MVRRLRGEVVCVDLNPLRGHEQEGRDPRSLAETAAQILIGKDQPGADALGRAHGQEAGQAPAAAVGYPD
jgi:hypothetical protein